MDNIKELSGTPPLSFVSDGSDLLDWSITGAAGGVGKRGINYLKIEPKTVNDGDSGTITYSYIGEAPLVAPVGSPKDITYQQWIKPTYSRSTTSIYDRDIHIVTDDRVPGYESSFWFADLKAGTYKLISEAYNGSATFTYYGQNRWTVLNDPYEAQSRYPYVALYKPGSAEPLIKAKILVDALSGRSGIFVHEEFTFTVDEDTRVGFFGVFPNACRFMIVDEDVQAELPVESSSEKTCWEPFRYELSISVVSTGGGITSYNINLGTQPLQAGSSISLASTGQMIATYYGRNMIKCDSAVQPSMYIKYVEGEIDDMWAAERPEQINVYDINEPQDGFDHNGIAILCPSECYSDKEERGRWDITITHPIDEWGKWTYIACQNVVKVNKQLFRIDETEICAGYDGEYITAHAKHLTYDMADLWINDVTIEADDGEDFAAQLMTAHYNDYPAHTPKERGYTFDISSDLSGGLSATIHDQTIIGALFGDDNSLAASYGGEVYRDNFHISINKNMEGAPAAPAFAIRYGTDLKKISFKIDFSEWVTELFCLDNFGNLWGISYVGMDWVVHHHKTKRVHFTYSDEVEDTMGRLIRDGDQYWASVSSPKITIKIEVVNIKSDPKYKDFVNLQKFDVGYKGIVYVEHLGINVEMKIVSMRRDELTGEAISIVLGNTSSSLIRAPVMAGTVTSGNSIAGKQAQIMQNMRMELESTKLKQLRTWGGMKAYTWGDVKKYRWEEIKSGRIDD